MSSRCRGCGTLWIEGAPRCRACGDARALTHPDLDRLAIAHVDCDAFFAAVEKRDDPTIAAKPVIVGGGRRGVVAAACYVARAYGVRSAMPMFKALKACPAAVVVRPNHAKYRDEGMAIRAMMQALTPLVEPVSIDEAFLDLSGCEALAGAPASVQLIALQRRVLEERGLTVSVGLAPNKFLAKLASDLDKPHGFSVIGLAEAPARLAPMPVTRLPGVGPAAEEALRHLGVTLIGDLERVGAPALTARLGPSGARLAAFARGEDDRPVNPHGERKSLSAETTFFDDIADRTALEDVLWGLCEKVAARARAAQEGGRTVTLKLKTARFRTLTRQRPLSEPTILAGRLFEAARAMLGAAADGRTAYRLIGVGLSDLAPAADCDRGDLVDTRTPKRAAAEAAIAAARGKFGADAVVTGRALRGKRG